MGEDLLLVLIFVAGIATSLAMLWWFSWMYSRGTRMMTLPPAWAFAAFLPLLVAIGFVAHARSTSGFAVDLRSELDTAPSLGTVTTFEAVEESTSEGEAQLSALADRSLNERGAFNTLSFVSSGVVRYAVKDIEEEVSLLPNLRYIDVRRETGEFICVLGKEALYKQNRLDSATVRQLTGAIQSNVVTAEFADIVVKEKVRNTDSLLKIARAVFDSPHGTVALVDNNDQMMQVVTRDMIRTYVTRQVMEIVDKELN